MTEVVFDRALLQITKLWTDDDIRPGWNWKKEIPAQLRSAEIVLLLLTPEFLASKFCVEVEGAAALRMAGTGRATVYAVLLEECDYQAKGFDALPLLSDGGKPLRPSSNAQAALDEMRLEIKYEAYRRFEERNGTITNPRPPA